MIENQRNNVFQKIEFLAKKKEGSVSKALRSVDIGSSTWHNMKQRSNMTLETLEKFAMFFGVDIGFFFTDNESTLPAVEVGKEQAGKTGIDLPADSATLWELLIKEREEREAERAKYLEIIANQAKR
jgi:hypothetical protein